MDILTHSFDVHVNILLQVMLGVHGDALSSSILMKRSKSPSTIIEFFPDGKYSNENEFMTRAVGMGYIAWRNTK